MKLADTLRALSFSDIRFDGSDIQHFPLLISFLFLAQFRKTSLSAIRLSVSGGSLSSRTENGTSGGASFSTGWAHHWSEFISGSIGAGIMFMNSSNFKLYAFDTEENFLMLSYGKFQL